MKSLMFSNTWIRAGKTFILIAVGLKLKKKGLNLTYFNPLCLNPKRYGSTLVSQSAILTKEILGLKDTLEKMCPVVLTQDLIIEAYKGKIGNLKEKVVQNYKQLSKGKDLVLIEGAGSLERGTFLELSDISISQSLNSKVILIDRFAPEVSIDSILKAKEDIGERLIGVVLNHIPHFDMNLVKDKIKGFLKTRGLDILAMIPRDDILSSISVRELNQKLGGKVLCCHDKLDDLVERFSIGAMTMEKALGYFKRSQNKAVVTGGDRADIQLAALETSTRALILTGNMYPNDIIIAKAEEKGVPVIVVRGDTLSTIELMETTLKQLEIGDKKKIKRGLELIETALDWKLLYKKLGLWN